MNIPEWINNIESRPITEVLSELMKLASSGTLDKPSHETLRQILSRHSETKAPVQKDNEVINSLTAEELVNDIKEWRAPFMIFWTNGQKPGHWIQYQSSWILYFWDNTSLYTDNGLNGELIKDPENCFVQIRKMKDSYLVSFRIADFRVDSRSGSYSMVWILFSEVSSWDIEKWIQDIDLVKNIIRTILEKGNSPLRWVEQRVRRAFLV